MSRRSTINSDACQSFQLNENSEPGRTRTRGILLRSRVTTLIKTCRSERKAEDNQQVVSNADRLLAPSLSPLSSRFGTICHNYYYVLMTAERLPWAHATRLQQLRPSLLTTHVSDKSENLFSLKANANGMKTRDSRTVRAQRLKERCGRRFTAMPVSDIKLERQR